MSSLPLRVRDFDPKSFPAFLANVLDGLFDDPADYIPVDPLPSTDEEVLDQNEAPLTFYRFGELVNDVKAADLQEFEAVDQLAMVERFQKILVTFLFVSPVFFLTNAFIRSFG